MPLDYVTPFLPDVNQDLGDYVQRALAQLSQVSSAYDPDEARRRREEGLARDFQRVAGSQPEMGAADYAALPLSAPVNLVRNILKPVFGGDRGSGWEAPGETMRALTGVDVGTVPRETMSPSSVLSDLFTRNQERQAQRYKDLLLAYRMREKADTGELGRQATNSERMARFASSGAQLASAFNQAAGASYEPTKVNADVLRANSATDVDQAQIEHLRALTAAAGRSGYVDPAEEALKRRKLEAETILAETKARMEEAYANGQMTPKNYLEMRQYVDRLAVTYNQGGIPFEQFESSVKAIFPNAVVQPKSGHWWSGGVTPGGVFGETTPAAPTPTASTGTIVPGDTHHATGTTQVLPPEVAAEIARRDAAEPDYQHGYVNGNFVRRRVPK